MFNIIIRKCFLIFFSLNIFSYTGLAYIEKKVVVVIPSYNNENWYKKNLDSVFSQNYRNYHVIYINDASTDKTYELVKKYIKENNQEHKITLTQNAYRQGSLANLYKAIHSCDDEVIIACLDGDDWFAHSNVLNYINNIYSTNDVWLTYGHSIEFPSGSFGQARPISDDVLKRNAFREVFPFPFFALRTFYAWLFKKIKKKELLDTNGSFFTMAGDVAIMMPMVEMARDHFMFIPEILYVHNCATPINDYKISRKKQHETSIYVRNKQTKYKAIKTS